MEATGGIVGLVRILDGCAIDRLVPGMRGVLGERGRGVLKLVEGLWPKTIMLITSA